MTKIPVAARDKSLPSLIRIIAVVACCLFSVSLIADDEPANSKRKPGIKESFEQIYDSFTPSMLWNASTPEEHQEWKEEFQGTVERLLGETPDSVPLEVEWVEKEEFDLFVRHKIYIRSEPSYWIPVYYYVPHKIRGRVPAMVCLHGHSGIEPYIGSERKKSFIEKTRNSLLDYCVHFAKHGYVSAAIVMRGFNETRHVQDRGVAADYVKRSCLELSRSAGLVGMTAIGLRCWDVSRVVDFLETQEQVDSEKIGVAGLSGGGAVAMYVPAMEPRIKVAMIAGAFTSFRASFYATPHCNCQYVPGIMRYGDMAEIVALAAPRPVLLINGVEDEGFHIGPARKGFEKLKDVYRVLDVEDNVEADFFDGGHRWSNNKTLEFLSKHFGDPSSKKTSP